MILTGWWLSNSIVEIIQKETEISIYYSENLDRDSLDDLLNGIRNIGSIRDANIVDGEESYHRMVDILGKEAEILNYFDHNPFSPFIEVKIDMENLDDILTELEDLHDIDYIRDNRQIIDQLQGIINIVEIFGLLLLGAVGISTAIIISHIIRQGIYNNKDEISTLKLLGAPDRFIRLPFLMEGIFLTTIGGALASLLWVLLIKYGYSNINNILPFLPLPSKDEFQWVILGFIMVFSLFMGLIGSGFGLKSISDEHS